MAGRDHDKILPECAARLAAIETIMAAAVEERTSSRNTAEATAVNTALLEKLHERFDVMEGRQWGLIAKASSVSAALAAFGTWIAGRF